MAEASVGILLTHGLARLAAVQSRHEFILPEHLFIGLCKLPEVVAPETARKLGVPPHLIVSLGHEAKQLSQTTERFRLDMKLARRELRGLVSDGGHMWDD